MCFFGAELLQDLAGQKLCQHWVVIAALKETYKRKKIEKIDLLLAEVIITVLSEKKKRRTALSSNYLGSERLSHHEPKMTARVGNETVNFQPDEEQEFLFPATHHGIFPCSLSWSLGLGFQPVQHLREVNKWVEIIYPRVLNSYIFLSLLHPKGRSIYGSRS